jgi:hypothetical protein
VDASAAARFDRYGLSQVSVGVVSFHYEGRSAPRAFAAFHILAASSGDPAPTIRLHWGRGGRPIVWPSASMEQEALGLSSSQVKAINRALIEAELLTMKDARTASAMACMTVPGGSPRRTASIWRQSPRGTLSSSAWPKRRERSGPR